MANRRATAKASVATQNEVIWPTCGDSAPVLLCVVIILRALNAGFGHHPTKLLSFNINTQQLTFLMEFLGGNDCSSIVLISFIIYLSFSFLIGPEYA
jgi:hypothetical protein